MKRFLFLFLFSISIYCFPTNIYYGDKSQDNICYRWENNTLFRGQYIDYGECMIKVIGNKIYAGVNIKDSGLNFTIKNNKLYLGHKHYLKNLVVTYKNHNIYQAKGKSRNDLAWKIRGNKVYWKNDTRCSYWADGYVPWYIWAILL